MAVPNTNVTTCFLLNFSCSGSVHLLLSFYTRLPLGAHVMLFNFPLYRIQCKHWIFFYDIFMSFAAAMLAAELISKFLTRFC